MSEQRTSTVQEDLSDLQMHLAEVVGFFRDNKEELEKLEELHRDLEDAPRDISDYDPTEKYNVEEEGEKIVNTIEKVLPELQRLENSLSSASEDVEGIADALERDKEMIKGIVKPDEEQNLAQGTEDDEETEQKAREY